MFLDASLTWAILLGALTTTYWGLLKQPDKQEMAKIKREYKRFYPSGRVDRIRQMLQRDDRLRGAAVDSARILQVNGVAGQSFQYRNSIN